MNSDFVGKTNSILCIMTNISALDKKIKSEELKSPPNNEKIIIWERELRKAKSALEKRRVMA